MVIYIFDSRLFEFSPQKQNLAGDFLFLQKFFDPFLPKILIYGIIEDYYDFHFSWVDGFINRMYETIIFEPVFDSHILGGRRGLKEEKDLDSSHRDWFVGSRQAEFAKKPIIKKFFLLRMNKLGNLYLFSVFSRNVVR